MSVFAKWGMQAGGRCCVLGRECSPVWLLEYYVHEEMFAFPALLPGTQWAGN